MDNEFSWTGSCIHSCPYNLEDNNSSVSSNGSDNDLDCDLRHPPILQCHELPTPYVFRINNVSRKGEAKIVTCPPFYLQLDHAIAVLWQIFDSDKEENWTLGIGQLQWALYFLKAIKDPTDGKRSRDIELAIRAIEDALLECYADMARVVMRPLPPQGIPCIICNLERNIPKSSCQICTSASWGLLGPPRRSGQKSKINSNTDFTHVFRKDFATPPLKSEVKREQTAEQLKNEIEQLKKLALSLSITRAGDFNRKKVRVIPTSNQLLNIL